MITQYDSLEEGKLDQTKPFGEQVKNPHLEITNLRRELNRLKKTQTCIIIFTVILGAFSSILIFYTMDDVSTQGKGFFDKNFLVEPLRGNIMEIVIPWQIEHGQIMNVNIADPTTPEKTSVIKEAILSEKMVNLDNELEKNSNAGSIYYAGWQGALEKASEKPTKLFIPTKFNITEIPNEEGEITIKLSRLTNDKGFLGDTKLEKGPDGKIVKAVITIYEIDRLSTTDLSNIIRHEFGHALGLGHSIGSDDLMHDVISNPYNYVSNCDINAINELYNGNENREVICKA